MAQWEHKEATWHAAITIGGEGYIEIRQINLVKGGLINERWTSARPKEITSSEFRAKGASFTQWLDFHCSEGWEVFKISRDFNSEHQYTWCVFRRLV